MQMNLISGNTFGGIFWSDGCSLSPMLPDIPLFTKCSSCNLIFNLKNCAQTESTDEDVFDLPNVAQLDITGLEEAISQKVYETEREEIHLRIRLWWAMNKRPFKTGEYEHHEVDQNYLNNAKALLGLLCYENEDELLIIAELYRNLGMFAECRKVLSGITDKRYENRTTQIEKACSSGISSVIRLS